MVVVPSGWRFYFCKSFTKIDHTIKMGCSTSADANRNKLVSVSPLEEVSPLQKAAEKAAVHTEEGLQFIEGKVDITMLNNEIKHHTIRTWLKEALRLAYLSPALKESIKRLLAVNNFTANMTYMEIFTPLQEHCQQELLQLGRLLKQMYANSPAVQSIGQIPTVLHPELSNQQPAAGSLRQDNPLVGLSAGTLDMSDFNGESIYIHFLRLLALLLNEQECCPNYGECHHC